jgi:hypothetical protein
MPITPGHVEERWRAAFGRAIRRYRSDETPSEHAFAGSRDEAGQVLRSVCGLLWNCTDELPDRLCRELGLPAGSTYAGAARKVRWKITST